MSYQHRPDFFNYIICHYDSPSPIGGIRTLNLRILSGLFYHCATASLPELSFCLSQCWWWHLNNCLRRNWLLYAFLHFVSLSGSGGIRAFNLKMLGQVFDHCAADKSQPIFFLQVVSETSRSRRPNSSPGTSLRRVRLDRLCRGRSRGQRPGQCY